MLFSYSRFSFGFRNASSYSDDWARFDQHMGGAAAKTVHWRNTTLISQFNCQSTPKTTASIRGPKFDRESICTVQNLCVDGERGAWVHLSQNAGELPLINVVAADPGSDSYYRPAMLDQFPVSTYRFVDETIFLYGRDPTHRPTWALNNLLSLHSVMTTYGGSRSSWFMSVTGQENTDTGRRKQFRYREDRDQGLDTYLLAPHGQEIVLNQDERAPHSSYQISPPSISVPTCFARAVIGLQSRCTRPYCENLVGGSDLIDSLRTKALDVLSPSMIRFQKTDPSIVHPISGENVPVVSEHNTTVLEGESAPRSRIQVALLGRYGNTSIPNANLLELSLLAKGFAVKTIHLDHPAEISLAQAAQLFKEQSILLAPQGDGLGYSTWMESGTVVISILPRFTRSSKVFTDRMMAFGKRFFAWDCQDETCVQPDRDLAHECIEAVQASYEEEHGISAAEFEEFVNMKQDFRLRPIPWKAIADCYTKDVSRRIHVGELTTLIESLAKDFTLVSSVADGPYTEDHRTRRALNRRGVDDEDSETEGDDLEDQTTTTSESSEEADDGSGVDSEEDNDLEREEGVRIQPSKEESDVEGEAEGEDINLHEYDELPTVAPSSASEDDEFPNQKSPTTTGSAASPPPASTLTAPNQQDVPATQGQSIRAALGFAEFCKKGRCCGAARLLESDDSGQLGVRSLTPCASSMAAIVFGARGVWGQVEESTTVQESQDLVWQVDLGRRSEELGA
ncbi:hypothetical protein BGZ68_003234 [Mortierella alpina]|nr:hypothetical protein BGZ68_003234 [Mortierella alpina]